MQYIGNFMHREGEDNPRPDAVAVVCRALDLRSLRAACGALLYFHYTTTPLGVTLVCSYSWSVAKTKDVRGLKKTAIYFDSVGCSPNAAESPSK